MAGGSKKGEHRGNARKRSPLDEARAEMAPPKVRAQRKPAGPAKPKGPPVEINPATMRPEEILTAVAQHTGRAKQSDAVGRALEFSAVVHGRKSVRDMSPKETMLENMWYFQQAAYDYEDMLPMLAQAAGAAESDDEKKVAADAVRRIEYESERMRRAASEEAQRAAPYYHPRLAAVQVRDDSGEKSSADVLTMLFDAIDEKYRDGPIIDHQPAEKKSA